ncbi:MAG: hypothetical protein IKH53_04915 [Muribaculaceae bacterium]|nr:hypothetical protein [Muribaculaceae bacterium]
MKVGLGAFTVVIARERVNSVISAGQLAAALDSAFAGCPAGDIGWTSSF